MDPGHSLLLIGLDSHKTDLRTAHCLADRLRVRRVVLIPPYMGLGISRGINRTSRPSFCSSRAQ
jgi:hypothetical protein